MADEKPLLVFWSKAAVSAAGPRITELQAKLIDEAADIISQARDWFLHAMSGDDKDSCYTCTGEELPDQWKIFVQVARYKPLSTLANDHPDVARRGQVVTFPEALKDVDNEIFAPFEDVGASFRS